VWCSVVQCGAVCCSVLQCGAVWCSVVQCGAVCCSVLQCVAACCSVLQCVAVCSDGYQVYLPLFCVYRYMWTYVWEREKEGGCRKVSKRQTAYMRERWGAGVEYHFQEI